jgi:23S rRNA pseudouridine1911/1915/1917 synthase
MHASLVYLDEQLAVFNKPPGLSLATPRADAHAAVRRLIDSLPKKESAGLRTGPLWLVHRLDAGTTGLVLVARDEQTHRELSQQLSRRLIDKIYLALVWGHPRPRVGRYEWPITADRRDRRRMKTDVSGQEAVTDYRVLATAPHVALLELHPKTGRTHQLRVHLSRAGHWIVGDDLYGGARHRGVKEPALQDLLNPPHLLLHAWRLELPELSTMGARRFEAPLPGYFERVLEALNIMHSLPVSSLRSQT